jgi:hypothetical protein
MLIELYRTMGNKASDHGHAHAAGTAPHAHTTPPSTHGHSHGSTGGHSHSRDDAADPFAKVIHNLSYILISLIYLCIHMNGVKYQLLYMFILSHR